jgi:CO dehydrogenase maturation factor
MCDSPHEHEHEDEHEHEHDHFVHTGSEREFRVVVTGKGGVGKTSLTALLARLLARASHRVLALDADPQMNLPHALGLSREAARRVVPLSRNGDYVEKKTGARPAPGSGYFFASIPTSGTSSIVRRNRSRWRACDVMGTVVQPAAGCLCPGGRCSRPSPGQ